MNERWLLFVLVIVPLALGYALGYWLAAPRSRGEEAPPSEAAGFRSGASPAVIAAVALALLVLGLRILTRFFPLTEYALLPHDAYAIIRPWWSLPFGMLALGAGAHVMSTRNARILVTVFGLILFVGCAHRLLMTALFDPDRMTGKVHPATGVCPQTTSYTCGAAGAATLLHHHGIEATEAEMARLCWTNQLSGTDEFCVARGLRHKLAGRGKRVALERLTFEELVARREPILTTVYWGFLVDHWVVVSEVRDDGRVVVLNPLGGAPEPWPRERFLRDWRRIAVTIQPE